MLRFALGVANVPDDKVDELDKAMPGFARLAADAKQAKPILEKLAPLINQIEPLAVQLWPIAVKAWPDLMAVLPVVSDYIDLANGSTPKTDP